MYEYRVVKLVRAIDGDTVCVVLDLGFDLTLEATVRLLGIDCPELRDPGGVQAGVFTEKWFTSQPPGSVVFRSWKDRTEKYGRYLGDFMGGGTSLVKAIVESGLTKDMRNDLDSHTERGTGILT